jgi:hypothetical protein
MVYHHVHKTASLVLTFSQTNPVHTAIHHLTVTQSNIILPSKDWPFEQSLPFKVFELWVMSIRWVGAQGNACPATTFWSVGRPHLIYSASSPVPLSKNSILLTEFHHSRLVPQKCLPKRRTLNSAKATHSQMTCEAASLAAWHLPQIGLSTGQPVLQGSSMHGTTCPQAGGQKRRPVELLITITYWTSTHIQPTRVGPCWGLIAT